MGRGGLTDASSERIRDRTPVAVTPTGRVLPADQYRADKAHVLVWVPVAEATA